MTMSRGPDEMTFSAPDGRVNLSKIERQGSVAVGGVLTALGLGRGGIGGLLTAVAGGAVVWRGLTGHCSTYQMLGIDTAENDEPSASKYESSAGHIEDVITINKPAQELYDYWRDLQNLPGFMPHLKTVEPLGGGRSRWTMRGPGGLTLQYDAEFVNDDPAHIISWKTVGHSDFDNAGAVRFVEAPNGRGTEVRMTIAYIPPVGGRWAAKAAHYFGLDGSRDVRTSLRQFKQLMEAGEMPTTQGQPAGAGRN